MLTGLHALGGAYVLIVIGTLQTFLMMAMNDDYCLHIACCCYLFVPLFSYLIHRLSTSSANCLRNHSV